ncbi:MAG TPA: biotin transporter BioY [Pyrinomonadaceae bacterium]|jgi:biotin transport system substrate-specific component
MNTYAKAETLTGAWLAPVSWAKSALLVVAFSLFIALSAQVVVPLPFTPVPVTMQTFAVLLTGALLGSRLGALALVAYLLEGALGLPFFRGGGGGWLYLTFSPTAGYLLAFPLAAFLTGRLAERGWDRRFLTAAAAIALGSIVVLMGGWLGLLRFYSPERAFALGVAPFIIGDLLKIALAAAALPSGWALLNKNRQP